MTPDPVGQAAFSELAPLPARDGGVLAPKLRTPLDRLADKPRSLRACIDAKCWDCMGAGADPGTRRMIRECPCDGTESTLCPLWNVRPYQRG